MVKSHLHFLSMNRFVDRDALMRHFGHGIGHLEYGHMHETRDEDREEDEQESEYQDEEEGDELMDVDGNEEEEEPTDASESSDSGDESDDSDDSENSDESGYASF